MGKTKKAEKVARHRMVPRAGLSEEIADLVTDLCDQGLDASLVPLVADIEMEAHRAKRSKSLGTQTWVAAAHKADAAIDAIEEAVRCLNSARTLVVKAQEKENRQEDDDGDE